MDLYARLYSLSRHGRMTTAAIFLACFVLAIMGVLLIGVIYVQTSLRAQVGNQIAGFDDYENNLANTFREMQSSAALAPCSDAFMEQMDRVAFLPDGVHELMFAQGNDIICTVTKGVLAQPIHLGAPDISHDVPKVEMWLDRDLTALGQPGLKGTYTKNGDFMLVAPDLEYYGAAPSWLEYETGTRNRSGQWWHRLGKEALYQGYLDAAAPGFSFARGIWYEYGCSTLQVNCVLAAAPLKKVVAAAFLPLIGGIVLAALLAAAVTYILQAQMRQFWSFPSRFERTLSAKNVICHYQPLLFLRTGTIDGVEVLARWQDIDGRICFPDSFLPIVESREMTRAFTKMMVDNAYKDLMKLELNQRLRINFNIFPRDFQATWLLDLFADFLAQPERFEVVAELVETDQITVEDSRETIELLREGGIKTFIDDFGVGYSSIHYLAGLAADGVKLDRAFAMAPDGTLMATMLNSALEMIHKTGQELVVEGVETESRLRTLKATNLVDIVQGYYISRPIALPQLKRFFVEYTGMPERDDVNMPIRLPRA